MNSVVGPKNAWIWAFCQVWWSMNSAKGPQKKAKRTEMCIQCYPISHYSAFISSDKSLHPKLLFLRRISINKQKKTSLFTIPKEENG